MFLLLCGVSVTLTHCDSRLTVSLIVQCVCCVSNSRLTVFLLLYSVFAVLVTRLTVFLLLYSVFAVLVTLSQKSPCVEDILSSLLQLLDTLLSPDQDSCHEAGDVSLLGWVLTLLAHVLDTCVMQSSSKPTASSEQGEGPFVM